MEWHQFLTETHPESWVHSFALGDELFLDVHGNGRGFDSRTLAHETTHAIVARIYGARRWPLWLSEGFAEYMGDASVATRHYQSPRSNQSLLSHAQMTIGELLATKTYPADPTEIGPLYQTSAKFARYLFSSYPSALFPKFVDQLLDGVSATDALFAVYGAASRDMNTFEKRFATFTR